MNTSTLKNWRLYTIKEEIWNCLIHGIGIALSIAGLVVLVALSAAEGNVWADYTIRWELYFMSGKAKHTPMQFGIYLY